MVGVTWQGAVGCQEKLLENVFVNDGFQASWLTIRCMYCA